MRDKTKQMLEYAYQVLQANHPMTVRQVYYQLVAAQIIENKRTQYQAVSDMLVQARLDGTIPWDWMEDRLRRPREVDQWPDISDFSQTAAYWYRRSVWPTQPRYVEVWVEKDALSGIFEDITRPYGVTLCVGRGYDGWDSIHNAAERYDEQTTDGRDTTVLYFGDFDPSGEDMVRSLEERLNRLEVYPTIIKCALTADDIKRYNLPPAFTKSTDTRQAGFVALHGDVAVELDALPVNVLRQRIKDEVQARMDLNALRQCLAAEKADKANILGLLQNA